MSSGTVDGGSSGASTSLTPAQRLQEKHNAQSNHSAIVEDTIDEDDIAHPPPSMQIQSEANSGLTATSTKKTLSEKAAGKQKVPNGVNGSSNSPRPEPKGPLDTLSEEAFPVLGSRPKTQGSSPTPTTWGSKKPLSAGQNRPNDVDRNGSVTPTASSRASTPASGLLTPDPSKISIGLQPRTVYMPSMPLAGKHSEKIQFSPSQLLPRDQLKRPVLDVIRAINKKSKATVQLKAGPADSIIFEATGPKEAVRQALLDVAKEVGSPQFIKIPVPETALGRIIGRQGATIQEIIQQSGARVQVPRPNEETLKNAEDHDSAFVDIKIEGNAVSAESARKLIEDLVNDQMSTVSMRLPHIPPEYLPFLAGPRDSKISSFENGKNVKVHIPRYYRRSQRLSSQAMPLGATAAFVPDPHHQIRISGDRAAAQATKAAIEEEFNFLRGRITSSTLPINRGRHQFITGNDGELLHDFLEETGCIVILPPTAEDTKILTIIGPQDKIDLAVEKVLNLAASMHMDSIDIARHHPNGAAGSQSHARALTRYLQQCDAITQLERQHNAHIVLPPTPESPMNWEVYARDGKNTIRALSDIIALIDAYPPSRIRHMSADPFFHQHLQNQSAQVVRDKFGVHLLLPDSVEQKSEIVLVHQGPTVESEGYQQFGQRFAAKDTSESERLLREAESHILRLIASQEEIDSKVIVVPSKFQEKIEKFVSRIQQGLSPGVLAVQVRPIAINGLNGSVGASQVVPAKTVHEQELLLRGPRTAVEDLAEQIVAFVETEKQDEIERNHLTSFEFPSKYANHLIGRKGESINKYREEFNVDIQVNNGKVEIKGPTAKAELAKAKILALGKKLEDETTHILKIPAQHHGDIIGVKGTNVNRLQDRYNVRVQFPRNAQFTADGKSVGTGGAQAGASTNGKNSNQTSDQVVIRGPKKGADEAKEELLDLWRWAAENSHSTIVSVSQNQLPALIGQGGRAMESLRLSTGAQIDVPGDRNAISPDHRVQIQIKGKKEQVEAARKFLEEKAKIFDETVTKHIDIDKKYHKALIGLGGSNIRNMVVEAGGSDDRREMARIVQFPQPSSPDCTIKIEGNELIVNNLERAIHAFVREHASQVAEVLEVAPEKHRFLIGRGGDTRKNMEKQFHVSVEIPKSDVQGAARSQITIRGHPENIEKVKARISELIKNQEGETVQVPRRLHYVVSDNGQFFRRLHKDYKVTVDHAGHQPPSKPASPAHSLTNGEGSLPLITDDETSSASYEWEIVDSNAEGAGDDGDIPWSLKGSPENITKARAALQKAIEEARSQQHPSTGYLILPDPRSYRHIIGQAGSQISAIRRQTGCRITVPRDQVRGTPIEIVGDRSGVEQAKEIILDITKNGSVGAGGAGNRNGRRRLS